MVSRRFDAGVSDRIERVIGSRALASAPKLWVELLDRYLQTWLSLCVSVPQSQGRAESISFRHLRTGSGSRDKEISLRVRGGGGGTTYQRGVPVAVSDHQRGWTRRGHSLSLLMRR